MTAHKLDGLLRWLNRAEWAMAFDALLAEHVGPAALKLELGREEVADILGYRFSAQISGWVFEDLSARRDEGQNLVDDYLKRRGWKETVRTKTYLATLRDSVVSLYEVSGLVPGESFLARDLIRGGEPVRVMENMGSRSLRPWDRLATRILPRRDEFEMSGGALVFEHAAADALLAKLRRDAPVGTTRDGWTGILAGAAPAFTEAWLLDNIPRLTGRVRPKLVNDDGDELAMSTTLYPLRPEVPRGDIVAALNRLESLTPGGSSETWSWIGESRRAQARSRPEDDKISLGSLELTDDSLWLSTNSPARMKRLRALVEPAIAGLVGAPFSEVKSIDEVLAEPPTEPPQTRLEGLSEEEERRMTREMQDRHYAAVLDEAVPFLGGVSPRTAVQTEKGRQMTAGWLKYLENRSAKEASDRSISGYDFTWLWERLGIAHLRQ